ncbi:MAG: hypothetical protein KDE27_22365 [Planctomycetes bacterium]|nr:hypothetical protein [Planctomycetota bacterium]
MLRTVSLLSFTSALLAQEWRLEAALTPPPARQGACLVHDSARGVSVLFGGYDWTPNVWFADTWEYDGAAWVQRQTGVAPSARERAGMCYDESRGMVVLFGGLHGGTFQPVTYFGDTWEYDGTTWQPISPPGISPSARFTELTYDAGRGLTVLFGGYDAGGRRSDTWEYDGTAWAPRQTPHSPPLAADWAVTFDRRRGVVVAHPGFLMGSSGPFETWEYDGADWTKASFVTSPGAYPLPKMTYDRRRDVVVLVGCGYTGYPDTWEYDGTDWQLRATHPTNDLRGQTLTFDDTSGSLLMFGGEKAVGPYIVGTNETSRFATFAAFETLGAPCPGTLGAAALTTVGNAVPRLGTTFAGQVVNLVGSDLPILFLGLAEVGTSLGGIGLPACTQHARADVALPLTNQAGSAAWQLTIPVFPDLQGVRLAAQALVLDASLQPRAATNGARLTVGW